VAALALGGPFRNMQLSHPSRALCDSVEILILNSMRFFESTLQRHQRIYNVCLGQKQTFPANMESGPRPTIYRGAIH
jgi:hypothetical protein